MPLNRYVDAMADAHNFDARVTDCEGLSAKRLVITSADLLVKDHMILSGLIVEPMGYFTFNLQKVF